jgi:HD-GYP domain-containing protein (c-di-GMP phosphodiesterase class II)
MDEERLTTLENAALLHDIGLVCVPDAMLDRPRELDPQERDLLEEHPEVGARILAGTEMGYLAPLVAAHHERWDGTGYPSGLAGEAIPLESRIIAACDTYDGATSARPHHGARDRRAGIAALTEGMAGALDPTVTERLIMQLVTDKEPSS